MNVEMLTLGPIATNCFIIWNDQGQALVIDPGSEPDQIEAFLEKHGLEVIAYPVTHAHADHISALADLHGKHKAPIAMHPEDLRWAFEPINQLLPFLGPPARPAAIERQLAEGQEWTDGPWTYRVLETPGHSPGAVAFHFEPEKAVFVGDTLFQGSVGRTDLLGGDARLLSKSLEKLARLPDDTVVYPGHGMPTTIGQEKKTNYFMQNVLRA